MLGTLTGCSDAIPEMSDEELHMVEEYAAELLLKYDKNYSPSTLSEEEIEKQLTDLQSKADLAVKVQAQKAAEAAAKEEEESKKKSDDNQGNAEEMAPVYADIDEFLGLDNVSIEYSSYLVGDSYPQGTEANDWQGIARASAGNSLVAFEFDITNNSSEDYLVDLASMALKASIKVNGRVTKSPVTTLLMNDFMHYRDSIPANETVKTVIIIELSGDDAASLESAVLTLKKGSDKALLTLL